MTTHAIASRDEWLGQRLELELTHQSDALAKQRQALPWVRVEKDYRLAADQATRAPPICSAGADDRLSLHARARFQGRLPVLFGDRRRVRRDLARHHDMFWAISRAPLEKLDAYKARMG